MFAELVVGEADDAEENCQDGEAHELDWLAADGVDCGDGDPVAWNCAGADDDQVANGGVVEDLIHVLAARVTDCCKDDRVVEAKTIKGNLYAASELFGNARKE